MAAILSMVVLLDCAEYFAVSRYLVARPLHMLALVTGTALWVVVFGDRRADRTHERLTDEIHDQIDDHEFSRDLRELSIDRERALRARR